MYIAEYIQGTDVHCVSVDRLLIGPVDLQDGQGLILVASSAGWDRLGILHLMSIFVRSILIVIVELIL